MAKTKTKAFTIWANLRLSVSIDISAESLEEALAKASQLTEDDFVKILGSYNDGHFEITGVTSNQSL